MLTRRQLIKATAAAGAVALAPRLSLAAAPTDKRLAIVLLRGGLDGLHAVPPHADADYRRLRPRLAIGEPGTAEGALDLDGYFGLHPALAPIHDMYRAGEVLVVPASTTRYRKRSHFDGQNLLENGTSVPFGAKDGWLNRALAGMGDGSQRLGLALGPTVPLMLHGEAPVRTWSESALPKADEDFLRRLAYTYRDDPLFAKALADAQGAPSLEMDNAMGRGRNKDFQRAAEAAATLLAQEQGARVAVIEAGGWDTHFGQERRLKGLFEQLSAGLTAFKQKLGPHWRDTVVIVVSEFGRTAAENGSRGTDHGTGGVAFAIGGAVRGGRVHQAWPGLGSKDLLDGRDLRPLTTYESLFKGALVSHMNLSESLVEGRIFPDSRDVGLFDGLVRHT